MPPQISRNFVPLSQIKVADLRTTFFWPLTLERVSENAGFKSRKEFLKQQVSRLVDNTPWEAVPDGLRHLPKPVQGEKTGAQDAAADPKNNDFAKKTPENLAMADAYGEFVYFHDFIQRTLFGNTGDKDDRPLRLFQRTDIKKLEVDFGDSVRLFDVERVNLYIVKHGVAVLTVQVAASPTHGLTLKSVLDINNTLRRSHVPYFFPNAGRIRAGGLAKSVKWIDENQKSTDFQPSLEGFYEDRAPADDPAAQPKRQIHTPYSDLYQKNKPEERRVLPLQHWQWLLNGPSDTAERFPIRNAPDGYRWRHFSDDRFPILTTVILQDRQDYYNLTDGHWNRLAFVDSSGTDPNPYAAAFLQGKLEKHCYDRYHFMQGETKRAPSRYLMCDYAMTAVTSQQNNDFAPVLQMHMQRHYYQMFLLQVIDKAVMLGLSSRITRAVENFGRASQEADLSQYLQRIERDFLQYVHRFRFTGVSGQLQGIELHAKLRDVMGLDAMFQDIKSELETAVGFLASRQSDHATEAAERLNIIATLGVVMALLMGFFSMNILTDKDLVLNLVTKLPFPWPCLDIQNSADASLIFVAHLFVFSAGLAIIFFMSWLFYNGVQFYLGRRASRPNEKFLNIALSAMSLLGGVGVVLSYLLLAYMMSAP